MPRSPAAPPPPLPFELPSSPAIAHTADPCRGGSRGSEWNEDEDPVVRCDVVLGELRPPNDAMAQMIREKLGRLLQGT